MPVSKKTLSELQIGDVGIIVKAIYAPYSPYPYQQTTSFPNEVFKIIERAESWWKFEIINALHPEAENKVPRYWFIYESDLNERIRIIDKTALQKIAASIAEAISG